MSDEIGQIDVCFVIDTTSSMAPYIDAARQHAVSEAWKIAKAGDLDLRFAVVEYRDHPPQEYTFVVRSYPFMEFDALQSVLNHMGAAGGGDVPEAVWDGIHAGAMLPWRETSDHLMFLIGDSPPHGVGFYGDTWPNGCPCGMTAAGLVELLDMKRIRLYAHSIAAEPATTREFTALAEAARGACTVATVAVASIEAYAATMRHTSGLVTASRSYTTAYDRLMASNPDATNWSASAINVSIGSALGASAETTSGIYNYMRMRGLIPEHPEDA